MKIAWDEPKRQANITAHGLDLAHADKFHWDTALVVSGHPGRDGRPRFRAIGWLSNELVTLAFSLLGTEAVSVISLRRASRAERKLYEKATT